MTKTISLLSAIVLLCMTACKKENETPKITAENLTALTKGLTAANLLAGPIFGTDWSGTVQTIIIGQQSGTGNEVSANIQVPPGYVLVGGGVVESPGFVSPGAFITASYPDLYGNVWHVSSKAHLIPFVHSVIGYAVGLKLAGIDPHILITLMTIDSTVSAYASHPGAVVTLTNDYILVGGGAKINYGAGAGNLLVASAPSGNSWYAAGKDHEVSSPASITAYAIGLKPNVDGFGLVQSGQDSTSSFAPAGFGVDSVNADNTWVLSCPGGQSTYYKTGRMLTDIQPGIRTATVISSDLQYQDAGNTSAYIVKLRKFLK
jgi:hypothetical protein